MDSTAEDSEKRGRSEEIKKRSTSDSPPRHRRRSPYSSPIKRGKSPRRSRSPIRVTRRSPPRRSRSPVRRSPARRSKSPVRRSRTRSRSPYRSSRNSRSPSPRYRRTGYKTRVRSRSPRRVASPRHGIRRRESPSRDRKYSPYSRVERRKRRKSESESVKRRRYKRDEYSSSGSEKGGSRSRSRKRERGYGGRSTSFDKRRVKRSPSGSYERKTDEKKVNCATLCDELLSYYETSMNQRQKIIPKCRDLFDDSKFIGEDAELNEYKVSQYLNKFLLEKEKKDVSKRIFVEAHDELSYCIEFEPKKNDEKKGMITLFECSRGLFTRAYMFDDEGEIGERGVKLDDKVLGENRQYAVILRHLKKKGISDEASFKVDHFE